MPEPASCFPMAPTALTLSGGCCALLCFAGAQPLLVDACVVSEAMLLPDDRPKPDKIGLVGSHLTAQRTARAEAKSGSCLYFTGSEQQKSRNKQMGVPPKLHVLFIARGGVGYGKAGGGGPLKRLDGRHACELRCEPLVEPFWRSCICSRKRSLFCAV